MASLLSTVQTELAGRKDRIRIFKEERGEEKGGGGGGELEWERVRKKKSDEKKMRNLQR